MLIRDEQIDAETYKTIIDRSSKQGEFYWCVLTDQSDDGEVYFCADSVEVQENGALVAYRQKENVSFPTLCFAPGYWKAFFSASVTDGGPLCAMHWRGQLAVTSRDKRQD